MSAVSISIRSLCVNGAYIVRSRSDMPGSYQFILNGN
jgi:hypothetical protein